MLTRADLHDYQRDQAIPHIQAHDRPALWCPMGGGKGVCTLTALDDMALTERDVWPALVLGPLRVARSVWPNEPKAWDHLQHLRVVDATGDPDARRRALRQPADIYSINYEQLGWLAEGYGDDWPFKTVIADESTKLKSFRLRQGGKRAGAMRPIAHTKVKRWINLTGTPAPNGLKDVWGPTWFQDEGERLGKTYTSFEQRWFRTGFDGYSVQPMPHAQREIEEKLRDICMTVDIPAVGLPILNRIEVELPPKVRDLYKQMEKDMFLEIESIGVEAFSAAAKTSKLLQLCAGSLIHNSDTGEWKEVHDAKLDALEDVIEEAAGAPVLVAYHFKADLARLQKRFPRARVLDSNPATITRWNDGAIPILLAHPASAGHGLNLARGGNIICFFSMDWNLEHDMQIIERLGPMRQKQAGLNRPVFVHRIIARNTLDEAVLERLDSKCSVQEALLASMRRRK